MTFIWESSLPRKGVDSESGDLSTGLNFCNLNSSFNYPIGVSSEIGHILQFW